MCNMRRFSFVLVGIALTVFAVTSCNGKRTSQEARSVVNSNDTTVTDTTAAGSQASREVLNRVVDIYTYICDTYNKNSHSDINVSDTITGRYCSASWKKDAEAVGKEEAKHRGELGCFDYDFWIQGQDWDKVSFSNVTVGVYSPDKATAMLIVHNGKDSKVQLSLVRENGQWMIDDLTDRGCPQGVRSVMRAYYAK